jgi:hypothetical protein
MMQAAAAPAPSNEIVPDSWMRGGISSGGSDNSAGYSMKFTSQLPVLTGATGVKRTGQQSYNGTNISLYVAEYDSNGTFIRRSAALTVGSTHTLGSTCAAIRISFAFASSAGIDMTQAIVDQCYGAEWVV